MKDKIFQIVMTAVCVLSLLACSQEDIDSSVGQETTKESLRFVIYDNAAATLNGGSSSASNTASRRAATNASSMITTFEVGDQAGLYVVKGGNVVYDNVKLIYNVSGFWEAADAIEVTDEIAGAQFYAYYPYKEDAQFSASSSEPFADMVSATVPDGRQNTKSGYEAADIMVSGATTIGEYNTVQLPMQHQKAMVCIELPNSSYIFTNDGVDPYVVAKAENATFMLDGTSVQPYFDDASQSYRLIVEPGQAQSVKVTFESNGESKSFEANNLSEITKGKYAKYVVDGGASLTEMELQVGDYYCADGKIVSKDTPAADIPGNVVGVIFKIGTTETIRTANPNWSHAVVVSLTEKRDKWGTKGSTSSAENTAGWRYWYESYGLADQNRKTNATQLDESIMTEEGFEVTKSWRSVPEPLTIGDYTLDYTSVMNATMNSWIEENPLPASICSGWYFPSLVDWKNIEAQSSVLSTQITAAGGTDLLWNLGSSNNYWSCNVRAAGSNWCYVGNKTALSDRYKGVTCSSNANYRFLFAF